MSEKHINEDQITAGILMIYDKMRALEEKIDCILYTVCSFNDKDTKEAIRKYLISDYRNK